MNNKVFSDLKIIEDSTNGLVKLGTAERLGETRKFRILNNFNGRFTKSNPRNLFKIIEALNNLLSQDISSNTPVVGFIEGSVVIAYELARQRNSPFLISTIAKIKGYEDHAVSVEPHKLDKPIIIYGLEKGDKVIIVEDEISTGDSMVQFVKDLRDFGVDVLEIVTIVETLNFDAKDKIKKALGLEIKSLVKVELLE